MLKIEITHNQICELKSKYECVEVIKTDHLEVNLMNITNVLVAHQIYLIEILENNYVKSYLEVA